MSFWDIFHISKIKQENEFLRTANAQLVVQIRSLGVTEYQQTRQKIENLERESANRLNEKIELFKKTTLLFFVCVRRLTHYKKKTANLKKLFHLKNGNCQGVRNYIKVWIIQSVISLIQMFRLQIAN